jgi:hypothetical protein
MWLGRMTELSIFTVWALGGEEKIYRQDAKDAKKTHEQKLLLMLFIIFRELCGDF